MKRSITSVFCLVMLILLLSGCTQKKDITDFNLLAQKYMKAINSLDATAVANLYSEDATMTNSGSPTIKGRQAIATTMKELMSMATELKIEFTSIIGSGDQVCFEFREVGTFKDGSKLDMKGAFLAKVNKEGLVTEDRTYFDPGLIALPTADK